MNKYLFSSFLILTSNLFAQGKYSEQSLRSALSDQAHFNTSLERESHRFEKGHVNKYRLYDFYKRQARFHLTNTTT